MNVSAKLDTDSILPIEDRKVLEQLALERICACQYYDLADCMDTTSDDELIAIIEGTCQCELCTGSQDTISYL